MLGAPYFKSVTNSEIIVEWQQLASHGRRVAGHDYNHPNCKIEETSDGRSYMQQMFVKVKGQWRISVIKPEVIYHTGDLMAVGRPDEYR
ncbi:uncharacterized protein EAF01_000709 [Botrytis porri]|uniref:uncharacterized protein n=1 Tax=Botrytis porri TaxID=87229 RepID=UPI001902B00F|nr:uncharacterized protein EAF01_000709 [Botrytis porri]KAF7914303.1 hypothetical protein EAF01_000709 [Botrytis porri]